MVEKMKIKNGKLIVLKDDKTLLEEIQSCLDEKNNQIQRLQEEIEELKQKNYEDGKIKQIEKKMEKTIKDANRGFPISEAEEKLIREWKEKHIKEKHWSKEENSEEYTGAIGGRFIYKFIPTSIGIIGEIECSCGESFCFQEIL